MKPISAVPVFAAILSASWLAASPISWLPAESHLVMKLSGAEDHKSQRSFRQMLAFVTGAENLLELIDAQDGSTSTIIVGEWLEDGSPQQVAVLAGASPNLLTHLKGHVGAMVPSGHLIVGSPQGVARCLDTGGRSALIGELETSLDEGQQGNPAGWIWASRQWPGLGSENRGWPEWTLHGASSQIRSNKLLASWVEDRIRLRMITDAGNSPNSIFLAAELRAHLAQAGPGGESPIQKLLDEAQVEIHDSRVKLQMDLTAEALSQLARSQNARQVFRWQLSPAAREQREKILDLAELLEAKNGSRVADIGAGSGFLSVRLARLVGQSGQVWAVDINENSLEQVRQRSKNESYPQLEAVLGAEDDPRLPAEGVDAAIIVNAYHEMPQHREMLEKIRRSLRPGGRLLLLEPFNLETTELTREEQVDKHHIAPGLLESELKEAGFEILRRVDEWVRPTDPESFQRDSLLVARKPER